jgi:hypothetical protein
VANDVVFPIDAGVELEIKMVNQPPNPILIV